LPKSSCLGATVRLLSCSGVSAAEQAVRSCNQPRTNKQLDWHPPCCSHLCYLNPPQQLRRVSQCRACDLETF
jgi:hypothetical protein